MGRKKKQEEHENHERWLISYADFITLLFAFFVVMYSISSVNEGKFRVLSSSMVTAFSDPQKSLAPIQYGTELKSPIIQHKAMTERDKDAMSRVGVDYQITPNAAEMAEMQKISDAVANDLKDLVGSDLVNVHKTNQGVEIEIKSSLLFASGQARLNAKSKRVLSSVARILNRNKADINVEGFTDNIPISSELFPSNWELSAARASSVVRLFARLGVAPQRMKAVGYGEYRAAASNKTANGRNQNRRVTIMVLNVRKEKRRRILEKKTKTLDAIGKSAAPIRLLPNMTKSVNEKSVPGKSTVKIQLQKKPTTTKIGVQKLKKLLEKHKSSQTVNLKKQPMTKQPKGKKAAPVIVLSPKTPAKVSSRPKSKASPKVSSRVKPKTASKVSPNLISPNLISKPIIFPNIIPVSPSIPVLTPIVKEDKK